MDNTYDHIHEEVASPGAAEATPGAEQGETRPRAQSQDLGTEFKEAYQAISSTVWGAKLGGFFGQVKKQGESYYEGARKELDAASGEASKGWTDLVSRAQALSGTQSTQEAGQATAAGQESTGDDTDTETTRGVDYTQPDFLKETEKFVSRFKQEGAVRLKQVQAAEDAADEALERFGTNMMSWFKDAVTIAPPSEDKGKSEVIFESKDAEGKRVVHATRFDAQLHVIHSRLSSFQQNPESEKYASWKESFDAQSKTDAIRKDLEKYDELRRGMEKVVPEQVSYADFWSRYYFLRHVIETEEQKRRELLKGSQLEEEEVAWDDDEEDEENADTPATREGTPKIESLATEGDVPTPTKTEIKDSDLLKPNEPRRSNEHSVADSDASYDIVSGAPSRGPDTPEKEKSKATAEQSDEEDWE